MANSEDVFYSNKQLFEMFTKQFTELQKQQNDLLLGLELTRHDLRKYNGLHQQLAEMQKQLVQAQQDILDIREDYIYDTTNPEGPLNLLSKKLSKETEVLHALVDKIDKKLDRYEILMKSRVSVGNRIIKWSGWIMSIILFFITLYTTFSK